MDAAKRRLWNRLSVMVATGFGLGYSPFFPGTAGALLGVVIVLALAPLVQDSIVLQAGVALAFSLIAVPLCGAAEKHFGVKDDRRIVADEFLTFPICMLGLPLTPWVLALAFLTNRLLDILKPPPARQWQRFGGGPGIVIDDVVSSLYSLLLNHLIFRLVGAW